MSKVPFELQLVETPLFDCRKFANIKNISGTKYDTKNFASMFRSVRYSPCDIAGFRPFKYMPILISQADYEKSYKSIIQYKNTTSSRFHFRFNILMFAFLQNIQLFYTYTFNIYVHALGDIDIGRLNYRFALKL